MAINQIANLGVKVDPRGAVTGANRAKRAITGIGESARGVKNRIMSMQGALLGLGAGALVKSIITTASEVESLQVRLKFLTGSAEDSAKAFETMTKFASQVPFSLEDIERASPLLLTVADDVDQLNELLSITGDIAAVSGLSFEATAGQLQRALSGGIASADLFRERGVKAFLGFEEGVQYSAERTSKHIFKLFRDGTTTAKGATSELADTFQGQVSMMQDAFRELKLVIADAGLFDLTAQAVKNITDILKDEETITKMQEFGAGIHRIGIAMGRVIDAFMGLPPFVRDVGIVLAFLGGKKVKLAVATVTAIAMGIDAVTESINNAKKASEDTDALENFLDFRTPEAIAEAEKMLNEVDRVIDKHFFKERMFFQDDIINMNDFNSTVVKTGDNLGMLSHNANMSKSAIEIMAESFKGIVIISEEANEKIKEFSEGLAVNIEDSIMRMTQGLMSFKDVVKNVFQYVAMQMVRNNIAKPLASSLSSIITGAVGGFATGTSDSLSTIFPPRANGGNVNAGQPYMVGERGAELFVPKSSGDIVPNNQLGGGQTINVTYAPQVNALDPRTAQTVIAENAPTIVGLVRQAFERNGQQVAL